MIHQVLNTLAMASACAGFGLVYQHQQVNFARKLRKNYEKLFESFSYSPNHVKFSTASHARKRLTSNFHYFKSQAAFYLKKIFCLGGVPGLSSFLLPSHVDWFSDNDNFRYKLDHGSASLRTSTFSSLCQGQTGS